MNNEKAKNVKRGGEKLRIPKPWSAKIFMNWFGIFMKWLEVKVHCLEIEVCHISSQFRRIIN